jgi:hypothetical protein
MSNIEDIYYPVKNGKQSYATKLEHIIDHKFTSEPNFLQGFISQDTNEFGGKQFLTISNFPAWLQTDIIDSQQDRHLYEIIPTGQPVRPYFDIEYDDGQLDSIETIDNIFSIIRDSFADLGIEISEENTSIFNASGNCNKMSSGIKASYHFIISDNYAFRNVKEHKIFMDNVLLPRIYEVDNDLQSKFFWTNKDGVKKCIIDSVPYNSNQSFRLPFQSKYGQNRVFVPITKQVTNYCIGVYSDITELKFIDLPVEIPTSYKSFNNNNPFGIPSESPEFEQVRGLCALLSNDFLYDYKRALELIFCLCGIEHSERMYDLIHLTCSRASNYEWKWVNDSIRQFKYKGFTINSLITWAEECTDKDTVAKVKKQYPVNYSHELFSEKMIPAKYTQINERYLSNSKELENPFSDGIDTIVIKSLLGTGKTHYIKNNIIASGNYKRVLVISPRKSYTHSQKGDLPEFTSYLDIYSGDLAHIEHLIIQVESLHRIGNMFKKYDLVLLDEVESILNQLHSVKTNAGNLITNHQALAMAVSTAGHCIMSDAFISDRTFNFCKELCNFDNTHYVENMCNPYKRQAIFLKPDDSTKCVANLGAFCERICEALRTKKKIVIVWTSKRKGDWFVKNFLGNWVSDNEDSKPSWIFYNSTSSKEEQEGLKNVNESWRDVQCLMMTTSITVGISYDPKVAEVEFDEAFLYGSAASAMPRDIAQALFRVRNLKANRLTYVIDSRGSFSSGARGFSNIWNETTVKENKLIRDHPFIKWSMAPSWARYNFVHCENEERCSRVEYKTILEEYLVRSGYELTEETHIPSKNIAEMSLETENIEDLFWENIEDIDSETLFDIQKLIKRGEASAEEVLQYKKANFRAQFIPGCDEADLELWWNKFYVTDSEGRFWNIVKEKRWTLDEVARAEANKSYAIMTGDSIKERETMERFLKIVGMKHSQEEILIGSERLEAIGLELSKCEKELRKGLGLRASRSTGEWKTKNTIDLIAVILESWGRDCVESIENKHRKNGKIVREYSLKINKDNTIWKNIYVPNVKINDFVIKISKK